LGLACDVTDEEQVAQSFALIQKRFGASYGIFANAGHPRECWDLSTRPQRFPDCESLIRGFLPRKTTPRDLYEAT
jgi:NAD(P)-dependent dehydrogenase (short-subunit alcohol dehydrogenase family)